MQLHGELFWNICDFWELESPETEARGGHNKLGRGPGARHGVVGCALLERDRYFRRKEAYIWKINHVKRSVQSDLRISGNI